MKFSREDKIKQVNRSPETVAVHDKAAWLNIFASDAVVEDPVGSNPVFNAPGEGDSNPVSRFYDTFVAPNHISFNYGNDYVCDMHVVRDLSVTTGMGSVEVEVPMHLLYELTVEDGELKIQHLAAHWELATMVSLLLKKGVPAAPVMASLSTRMLKNQGIDGAMGFISGARLSGARYRKQAKIFQSAFNTQDIKGITRLFTSSARIEAPHGINDITPDQIFTVLQGQLHFNKVLVAGNDVSCSMVLTDQGQNETPGVAIFRLNKDSMKIEQLSFYYE